MIRLRHDTPREWVALVERELVVFLQDHAANEHRVSRAALTLAIQHPEREELVRELTDVSIEELSHFKQVLGLLEARGAGLGRDHPDPYMRKLMKAISTADREEWLLRRLVLFAIVERRGYERFAMLGEHLSDPELAAIYQELARSEARHQGLYLRLARVYFDGARVDALLDAYLDLEAEAMRAQPLTPALH
ncbi:MAG: tRNA isopentenyl-2-thiomethyl-A-37 hydroxylase MiaE [Sandaracinaceae bacterium]